MLSASLPSNRYVFLFPCLRPCLIRLSREICGRKHTMAELYLDNTHTHTDMDTHSSTHICLIQSLHKLLGSFSLRIRSLKILLVFPKTDDATRPLSPTPTNVPRQRLVKSSISIKVTDLLTTSLCSGPVHNLGPLHPSRLRCLLPGVLLQWRRGRGKGSGLHRPVKGHNLSRTGAPGDTPTDHLPGPRSLLGHEGQPRVWSAGPHRSA